VLLRFLIKSTQQTSRKFPRVAKYLNSKIPKGDGFGAIRSKTPHLLIQMMRFADRSAGCILKVSSGCT
jgi:hypothetical protein